MDTVGGVTSFFFNQGILGVIIIVLGIVIVFQDRRTRTDVKNQESSIAVLQEKRVNDSMTYSEKFISTSSQLLNQNKELVNLIQNNQRALETIANILQNINLKRR